MKTGDLVRYKSNAFMGASPKSYGTGVVVRGAEPGVDPDSGAVWTDNVLNVMWACSPRTWGTKCKLEVINDLV